MTERYSFAVGRHLIPNISADGSVVWNQDNMDNSTLTDTINESFATAIEDSPSQYLSVLDSSNEISLENLNISLANPKLEMEESTETFIPNDLIEQGSEDINDQQVVVYTLEGSNELYGIQVAQDEDGNLQKYQFQFRKNADDQLEAIPETIQLLPMDEVIQDERDTENLVQEVVEENIVDSVQIFVQEDNSNEHILPDAIQEENDEQDNHTLLYGSEDIEEETLDIKPGILSLQNVKQEIQEQQIEYDGEETLEADTVETFSEDQEVTNFHTSTENVHEAEDDNDLIQYHHHLSENPIASEENSNMSEPHYVKEAHAIQDENFEHVEVNPDMEVTHIEENVLESQEELGDFNNENNMNDSDLDDYHIVEGLHITGDVDDGNNISLEQPLEKSGASLNNTNILRHALKTNKEQKMKRDDKLYLYVVQHSEKENVDSLSVDMSNLCKPVKTNPRSILKSSHAMFQTKNDNDTSLHLDERLGKRFARCKEAMQARSFHNFINKTTIPQAPIRKYRLPRKQKINPVERMDEEIVVQEVMVSPSGFVEAVGGEGFNKENLEVTEYVELSDSDDDYDPKKGNKKNKKHRKKKTEISINVDSDVSHDSIIELDESDDEVFQQKEDSQISKTKNEGPNSTPTKRKRGRPPKNCKPKADESRVATNDLETHVKKVGLESTEHSEKPEIPCPKCDKSFPSQNSLKTHLQHHSLQISLKNALPEWKYKCNYCGNSFKNNILLNRHTCSKSFNCSVCKKRFPDVSSLGKHKRIHIKEQLVKSTTVIQLSPKRVKSVPHTNSFKSSKEVNNVKCKVCGKQCSSIQILSIHMKSHGEFMCTTCSASFVSQFMLEKHVRENCVKSPQNNRKRIHCDKCSTHFNTYKDLLQHKVTKHGFKDPDQSVVDENGTKRIHGEQDHGGVPANKRLKNAYSGLTIELFPK